jgi:hypothetical protein
MLGMFVPPIGGARLVVRSILGAEIMEITQGGHLLLPLFCGGILLPWRRRP